MRRLKKGNNLIGAYVRAWVWVELETNQISNGEITTLAKEIWHVAGEIEVDEYDGKLPRNVSRSYTWMP